MGNIVCGCYARSTTAVPFSLIPVTRASYPIACEVPAFASMSSLRRSTFSSCFKPFIDNVYSTGVYAARRRSRSTVHHCCCRGKRPSESISSRCWGVTSTRDFTSKRSGQMCFAGETEAGSDPDAPQVRHHYQQQQQQQHHHQGRHLNQNGSDPVAQATISWVRSTVVGLNLCPWAGGALVGGGMAVVVYPPLHGQDGSSMGDLDGGIASTSSSGSGRGDSKGEEVLQGLIETAAAQALALGALQGAAAVNATTLVVARPPLLMDDFSGFLEVVQAVDNFIDEAGLRGIVQLATFHPLYQFADTEEDDASNFTNRSPYPVLHLLLENQVSAAVAQVGDPAKVWEKNVETTRALGADAMRSRIEACIARPPSTPPPISVELPRGDEEEGRER